MHSLNCWEFTQCGREPGGENAATQGICPAATARGAHGLNGGKNGGRACWAIAGSFARGEVCGTVAAHLGDCMACEFFARVGRDEGNGYQGAKSILAALAAAHPRRRRGNPRQTAGTAASGTARETSRTPGTSTRPPG
ncbi:MAG TPA: hypothetical protein VMM80_03795 [Bacteroidota bacterium]|nr:hypothetical protein [Bacteroidota bacterium]